MVRWTGNVRPVSEDVREAVLAELRAVLLEAMSRARESGEPVTVISGTNSYTYDPASDEWYSEEL